MPQEKGKGCGGYSTFLCPFVASGMTCSQSDCSYRHDVPEVSWDNMADEDLTTSLTPMDTHRTSGSPPKNDTSSDLLNDQTLQTLISKHLASSSIEGSGNNGGSDILQSMIDKAVKKALLGVSPSLMASKLSESLEDPSQATQNDVAVVHATKSATEMNVIPLSVPSKPTYDTNGRRLYLPPANAPAYSPTPIEELQKKKKSKQSCSTGISVGSGIHRLPISSETCSTSDTLSSSSISSFLPSGLSQMVSNTVHRPLTSCLVPKPIPQTITQKSAPHFVDFSSKFTLSPPKNYFTTPTTDVVSSTKGEQSRISVLGDLADLSPSDSDDDETRVTTLGECSDQISLKKESRNVLGNILLASKKSGILTNVNEFQVEYVKNKLKMKEKQRKKENQNFESTKNQNLGPSENQNFEFPTSDVTFGREEVAATRGDDVTSTTTSQCDMVSSTSPMPEPILEGEDMNTCSTTTHKIDDESTQMFDDEFLPSCSVITSSSSNNSRDSTRPNSSCSSIESTSKDRLILTTKNKQKSSQKKKSSSSEKKVLKDVNIFSPVRAKINVSSKSKQKKKKKRKKKSSSDEDDDDSEKSKQKRQKSDEVKMSEDELTQFVKKEVRRVRNGKDPMRVTEPVEPPNTEELGPKDNPPSDVEKTLKRIKREISSSFKNLERSGSGSDNSDYSDVSIEDSDSELPENVRVILSQMDQLDKMNEFSFEKTRKVRRRSPQQNRQILESSKSLKKHFNHGDDLKKESTSHLDQTCSTLTNKKASARTTEQPSENIEKNSENKAENVFQNSRSSSEFSIYSDGVTDLINEIPDFSEPCEISEKADEEIITSSDLIKDIFEPNTLSSSLLSEVEKDLATTQQEKDPLSPSIQPSSSRRVSRVGAGPAFSNIKPLTNNEKAVDFGESSGSLLKRKHKVLSPAEMILNRYKKLAKLGKTGEKTASFITDEDMNSMMEDVMEGRGKIETPITAEAGSESGGEDLPGGCSSKKSSRVAHTPSEITKKLIEGKAGGSSTSIIGSSQYEVKGGGNSKISISLRQQCLNSLLSEICKLKLPQKLSIPMELKGVEDENSAFLKAGSNLQLYRSLVVNCVKKIRSTSNNLGEKLMRGSSVKYETPKLITRDSSNSQVKRSTTDELSSNLSSKFSAKDLENLAKQKMVTTHMHALAGKKGSALHASWSIEGSRKGGSDGSKTGQDISKYLDCKGDVRIEVAYFILFKHYMMSNDSLDENGFPRPDPEEKGKAIIVNDPWAKRKRGHQETDESSGRVIRSCGRCGKRYEVDAIDGLQIRDEECIYHWGRLYKSKGNRATGPVHVYTCCKGDASSDGCQVHKCHVTDILDYNDLRGFVSTFDLNKNGEEKDEDELQQNGDSNEANLAPNSYKNYGVYALDCEMCNTTQGCELTRVTVLDWKEGRTVYETLVKPDNDIIDYNTRFSGIVESDLKDVKTTLKDVQAVLLYMFNAKTILIGHSLDSDLRALRLLHSCVVDTSLVFPHKMGLPYKRPLKALAGEHLSRIIQNEVGGHDSAEDALTCLDLMKIKVKAFLQKKLQQRS